MNDLNLELVAIEEGRAGMGRSVRFVDEARSRAISLFAAGAIAMGFLASDALGRDTIPVTGWIAIGTFIAFAVCTMVVAWPLAFVPTGVDLTDLLGRDTVSTSDSLKRIALLQIEAADGFNEAVITRGRWLIASMVLLTLDLLLWALALVESTA